MIEQPEKPRAVLVGVLGAGPLFTDVEELHIETQSCKLFIGHKFRLGGSKK